MEGDERKPVCVGVPSSRHKAGAAVLEDRRYRSIACLRVPRRHLRLSADGALQRR